MLTLLSSTTVQSASDPRIQGDLAEDCKSDVAPQGETFDFNSHEFEKNPAKKNLQWFTK